MFEYKIVQTRSPIDADRLNEEVAEGWMLVTVVSSDYYLAGTFFNYFCRRSEGTWADGAYADLRRRALEETPYLRREPMEE